MKTKRDLINYFFLFVTSCALWMAGLSFRKDVSILKHSYFDQHTRQVYAWLQGHITLDQPPSYLEIAKYKGLSYNSFPPTPALFELPQILFFGSETPSYLTLFLFSFAAVLAIYQLARILQVNRVWAGLVSLGFVFGTNVIVSVVGGGVWAQGQVYGFSLALIGLRLIPSYPKVAYFILSLAVGCRPFYLIYFTLFFALQISGQLKVPSPTQPNPDLLADWKTKLKNTLRTSLIGFSPGVLVLAIYNWVRFRNPFEFGHTYLPHSQTLKDGIFSFAYFSRNFYHAFIRLPSFHWGDPTQKIFEFNYRGTCFVLNNPLVAFGFFGLISKNLKQEVRWMAALVLCLNGLALLLHESNGWIQFGWRYVIDLIPIAVLGLLASLARLEQLESLKSFQKYLSAILITFCLFSIGINFYGIWWIAH